MTNDYTAVTEVPGGKVSSEQLSRLYTRYRFAAKYVAGRRVLEVACGAGLGLGYLARTATKVIGGDYTENLLRIAQSHYQGKVPLVGLDAHQLPFRDGTFDLVIIFEAIYYLSYAGKVIVESRRVLSDGGTLLISTWNKDWSEFIPGLLCTRYFSVPGVRDLLMQQGFSHLEFFGTFPTVAASPKQKIVSLIRRMAIALALVPKTLESREHFKRLFYGNLIPLKPEVEDGMAELYPLVPIDCDVPNTQYKVFYAVARAR